MNWSLGLGSGSRKEPQCYQVVVLDPFLDNAAGAVGDDTSPAA